MTHPKFVTNYTCQGAENNVNSLFGEAAPWESKTVHMSFVSGHSSMAWQSAIFCVLYIQSQMRNWNPSSHQILFIPLAQLLIIILAYFTSLTRVKDYWHHPGDVIAGGLIGATVQTINCIYIMRLFAFDVTQAESYRTSDSTIFTGSSNTAFQNTERAATASGASPESHSLTPSPNIGLNQPDPRNAIK